MKQEDSYMRASIVPMSVYRHFMGRFYLVLTVASNEEDGESIVVYQSLNGDGKVWSTTLRDFISTIPDETNETGQCHKYELVKDIRLKGLLNNVSTNHLVKELKQRSDNPYALVDLEKEDDKVLRIDYMVANIHERILSGFDEIYTEIEPIVAMAKKELAESYFEHHMLSRDAQVIRVVYLKESVD